MRNVQAQQSFLKHKTSTAFGGDLLKGHARTSRPLSTKRPVHLVLKSSEARGAKSFLNPRHSKRVRATVDLHAKKNGIKILRYQNVGNHIHIVMMLMRRAGYKNFVRAITGRISQALRIKWDGRPFTRLISWGKDWRGIKDYMIKNILDVIGVPRTKENVEAYRQATMNSAMGMAKSCSPSRSGEVSHQPVLA